MYLGILCTMINGFGRRGYYNSQELGLGRALEAMGHRVVVYKCLNRSSGQSRQTVSLSSRLTVRYLPVAGLGAHGYLWGRTLDPALEGLLCFADNQVFLPHIQRFCRRHGIVFVPYVGTAHSLHSGLHGKVMDAWFAAGTLKLFRAHPVIAKTDGARRELAALGVKDTVLAPVGLDTTALRQDFRQTSRRELRQALGLGEDAVVISSVCRMEAEKRPLELLELFARLHGNGPFRLLLVGDGPLGSAADRKIQELGLERAVLRLRRVPYPDMWKLYRVSDYFVNMNRGEIFGMAVMEAVYYGVSVAAIAAPGPSVTLAGLEGHCLCQTEDAIARWILGPRPTAEQLERSSRRLTERFTWDRCAQAFTHLVARKAPL